MSTTFLHTPPDHFGYMEDADAVVTEKVQLAITTYCLQQLGPALMAPVVGQFFGKFDKHLDKIWSKSCGCVAVALALPGNGQQSTHNNNKPQAVLDFKKMKISGIEANREAVNSSSLARWENLYHDVHNLSIRSNNTGT